eukprot:Nitzschia sp. Nitz4//scaffold328_size19456//13174//14037//NITZ4_008722-RA/size19456-processed-gene-0.35-mRNA-1//1//CDS//3329547977//5303//frame0
MDRFCMLLRAIRSVDQHCNQQFGPYPIYILVAKDYDLDPRGKDGPYSEKDRALLRSWAPHSTIHFVPVNLYSDDALEPGTTRDQILRWRQGKNGGVEGRDLGYVSMCRLWSGRLQSMSFLDKYTYYMRLDDDSLILKGMPYDPFQRMQQEDLTYVYRREASDHWGIQELWKVAKPHLLAQYSTTRKLPFTHRGEYDGMQPYNNFHISRVDFWRKEPWKTMWKESNDRHLFFKYRVGDANVHAIAVMMMMKDKYDRWTDIPYVHNSNDYPKWGKKAWKDECMRAYKKL